MARTREQARDYQRAYRARNREQATVRAIRPVPEDRDAPSPVPEIPGPGEFERMVAAELAELGDVAATRMPGQAAIVIAMARIMDNPMAIMQHPGASGQLRAALLALHEAAKETTRSTGKVRALRSRHVG